MHKVCSPEISRTCDKIEAVLARKAIDLQAYFKDLDPKCCGMIADDKFFAVIYCNLGHEFGVCQEEVRELANYFKKEDGRVCYLEFLKTVKPPRVSEKPFVTGLEWEDQLHVNPITPHEVRKLTLILTKISESIRTRSVCLKPLFQDYERMSRNCGTVTVSQFKKILYFAGLMLGKQELQLILKRFMKHCYTVNYVAFLSALDEIANWLKQHGNGNFLCPEKVIAAGVESLPRPEIDLTSTFGTFKVCHAALERNKPSDLTFEALMIRIKKHIYDNSIRARQFFEKFDRRKYGFITKSQFERGLDAIGLSGLHRLYVAPHDVEKILKTYEDPCDQNRVAWKNFCDDIDEVFTIKSLDKQRYRVVESPQKEVKESPRPGTADWDCQPKTLKQLAQEALLRIRSIIKSQRIPIETFFKDLDKSRIFHVSRCQMQRVFSMNSILLSPKEVQALMVRYGDEMGFNFWQFLKDIDDVQICKSKYEEIMKVLRLVNTPKPAPCSSKSFCIVDVFAKIKGQVTRKRINFEHFLHRGAKLDEGVIPEEKFRRSFAAAGINLEDCELDILCKSFAHPAKPGFIDHKIFCKTINEAFYQTQLEKEPRTVPIQHLAVLDDELNFLDLEERCRVAQAILKITRFHDDYSNMKLFFENRIGTDGITKEKLRVVLALSGGLMDLISEPELDVIFKCFSQPAGNGRTFDYKNFLMILSHVHEIKS